MKIVKALTVLVSLIFLTLLPGQEAYSLDVTLSWQDSHDSDVAGYRVFRRTANSSYDYNHPSWEGANTCCTIYDLDDYTICYFVVRAFDQAGNDSSNSNEVCYRPLILSNYLPKVYENAESIDAARNWSVYAGSDGATIERIYDEERGSWVMKFEGDGWNNGYCLNCEYDWHNRDQFIAQFDLKYIERFTVYLKVKADDGNKYWLAYKPENFDYFINGNYIYYGLGSSVLDSEWRTFTRNLAVDLTNALPDLNLVEVNGWRIRGSGRADNIRLLSFIPNTIYEDGTDIMANNWSVYAGPDGATISYIWDEQLKRMVVELEGDGWNNGYCLADPNGNPWHNTYQKVAYFQFLPLTNYTIYLEVVLTPQDRAYVCYKSIEPEESYISGDYYYIGLGSHTLTSGWQKITRDLQADLQSLQPGLKIQEVNYFRYRGDGRMIDVKMKSHLDAAVYYGQENGSTQGWSVLSGPDGATINAVCNPERGSWVVESSGAGWDNCYQLGDANGNAWHNRSQKTAECSYRFTDNFTFYYVAETLFGTRYICFKPFEPEESFANGTSLYFGLGIDVLDGQWHTLITNLEDQLKYFEPNNEIVETNFFRFRGDGGFDDIKLM